MYLTLIRRMLEGRLRQQIEQNPATPAGPWLAPAGVALAGIGFYLISRAMRYQAQQVGIGMLEQSELEDELVGLRQQVAANRNELNRLGVDRVKRTGNHNTPYPTTEDLAPLMAAADAAGGPDSPWQPPTEDE